MKSLRGFTIVELLIVIVVIAILAAISVVAYNGIQDRSKNSKVAADINTLVKAINLGRTSLNSPLISITNSNCTRCNCPYALGDTTAYSQLPKTHACWVGYYNTLTAIGNASGVNLSPLREGDPWGSPYQIDENELENGSCANRDGVWSTGRSGHNNGGTTINIVAIPFYNCT